MIDLNDIDERITKLEELKRDATERGDMRRVEFLTNLIKTYREVLEKEKRLLENALWPDLYDL